MSSCNLITKTILIRFVFVLVLLFSIGNSVIAQTTNSVVAEAVDSAIAEETADTAAKASSEQGLNKTQKGLFEEMKTMARADDNTIYSILGVLGVLSVVGVAMYMSFKSDDKKA